jgi:hypothetical protein
MSLWVISADFARPGQIGSAPKSVRKGDCGAVCVPVAETKDAANWITRFLRSSQLEDTTRLAFLAGYRGLQFLDLLFQLDDDTSDFIKTGADSRDRLSGGSIFMPQPFQLLFRSHIFP